MVALASLVDLYLLIDTMQYTDVADRRVPPEYQTKLSNPISFDRALPEVAAGVMPAQSVEVNLSNVNTAIGTVGAKYGVDVAGAEVGYGLWPYGGTGEVTISELLSVEDLRGKRARARIMDLETQAILYTFDGVLGSPKAGGSKASLKIETRHTQVFQQLLPRTRIVDIYPNADLTGAADQDATVIMVFGVMRKARLIAVSEVTSAYDYGLIYKPDSGSLTINAVYRDDKVVPTGDYSLVEAVAGYYVVRFVVDPRTSGQAADIRVTMTSTQFARHSDAVRWVIEALGKTVNAASFAVAAGIYASAWYGAPAGGLAERRSANDILNDLLLRGASLELNNAGEYVISVDTSVIHPASPVTIGAGDHQWQNADPDSVQREVISDMDQVGTLKLLGAYDIGFGGDSNYLITATQTVAGGTVVREDPCPYIGDGATLDREASYRAKRYFYSTAPLTLEADMEASDLTLGQLVPLWIPNDCINGTSYELSRFAYRASRSGKGDVDATFTCTFRGYNASIFTYSAGTVQVSPGALTLIDYTFTLPLAPTSLVLISETVQGLTGNTIVVHQAVAPSVNVNALVFRAIPTGSVIPLAGEAVIPCVPGPAGIRGSLTLTSGVSYTIQCFARNTANAPAFQDGLIAQILNYIPAGDTSVPPQVTGLTVTAGSYKTLNIAWTGITDYTRLDNYEVFVALDSGFSSLIKILTPRSADVSVTSLANGTTYYVRVRAVYKNRLPGAYSSTVSASTLRVATDDYGDDTISTPKYKTLSVTNAIIGNLAVTNAKINDLSAAKITTGLLKVNPSTGGATAIFVDNAGKIRIQGHVGVPSVIAFEDASGIEQSKISGKTGELSLIPTSDANGLSLSLGEVSLRWSSIGLNSANNIFLQPSTSGSVYIKRLGLQDLEASAPPGATPNRRIPIYAIGVGLVGYIWASV